MKVSVLYGKKITNAEVKGYVLGVNAQGNRLTSLVCADKDENEFAVNFKSVKSIKAQIAFDGEPEQPIGEPLRLGKPVYDCAGSFLGTLTDIAYENCTLKYAYVGKIKFACKDIICGDAVIVRGSARILKSDVVKNGKVLIKRGTPVTEEILDKAAKKGEYVQTSLKCL